MRRIVSTALFTLTLTACQTTALTPPQPSAKPLVTPNTETNRPPAIPEFPSLEPIPTPDPAAANLEKRLALRAPMADGVATPAAEAATGAGVAKPATSIPAPHPGLLFPEPGPEQPSPQAGLLTAGEWNDLKNWTFWQQLLQEQEWAGMPKLWGLNTLQRIHVQVQGPTGPLADIPVQLLAMDHPTPLFEARTNVWGEAELFAAFLPGQKVEASLQVLAYLGQETLSAPVSVKDTALPEVVLRAKTTPEPLVNADLMLVVDTTGSMGDELEYLKSELKNVAAEIARQNRSDLKLRLSTNFYRDLGDEYVVRSFPFNTEVETVNQQLAAQSAKGGGDFPEAVELALQDAIDEHDWSSTARARLLFLVLDAPPHQGEKNLDRMRTMLTRAAAKGIRIIPVASSGIDKETEFLLRMFAIATGGRYVFLTDDSGIGHSHLKPTVGTFTVEKLNALMVRLANAYISASESKPVAVRSAQAGQLPNSTD